MARNINFTGYSAGEPFYAEGPLRDAEGVLIETGTMTMQFALTPGGPSLLDISGSHEGDGVWSFAAPSLPATSGQLSYEIEDGTGFILLRGTVPIAEVIT